MFRILAFSFHHARDSSVGAFPKKDRTAHEETGPEINALSRFPKRLITTKRSSPKTAPFA